MKELAKYLAELAKQQSEGCQFSPKEGTEVKCKGALIYAYSGALTSWQDIEGVRLQRAPKPVPVEVPKNTEVKKMFVMSDLIDEECHTFNNIIILN